jgi:esterase/lipase
VQGVVAISTPWRLALASMAKYILPITAIWPYSSKSREPADATWFDKDAFKEHVSYDRNPIASAAELDKLLAQVRLAIPQIRVPVLLIQSLNDPTVLPGDADRIYAALVHAPEKDKLLVENSGHVVTRDAARQQAFEATAQFILRLESQAK